MRDGFHFMPRDTLVDRPTGMVQVMRDQHWVTRTIDGALLFYRRPAEKGVGTPQCNAVGAIAERLYRLAGYPSDTRIEQIPVVFVPIRIEDYQ